MKKTMDDLKIKRWLRKGEFSDDAKTIGDIIYEAGELLDFIIATGHEIVGQNMFQAEDGKWYTATVEVVVNRANPESVKELLEENEDIRKRIEALPRAETLK
jgi:hypothetical protein